MKTAINVKNIEVAETDSIIQKPSSSEMTMNPSFGSPKDMADMWDENRIDFSADKMSLTQMLDYIFGERWATDQSFNSSPFNFRNRDKNACYRCSAAKIKYSVEKIIDEKATHISADNMESVIRTYIGEQASKLRRPEISAHRERTLYGNLKDYDNFRDSAVESGWDLAVENGEWMNFIKEKILTEGGLHIKEKNGHAEGTAVLNKNAECNFGYIGSGSSGRLYFDVTTKQTRNESLSKTLEIHNKNKQLYESTILFMLEMEYERLKSVIEKLSYGMESVNVDVFRYNHAPYASDVLTFSQDDVCYEPATILEKRKIMNLPKKLDKPIKTIGEKILYDLTACFNHQLYAMSEEQLEDKEYLANVFNCQPSIYHNIEVAIYFPKVMKRDPKTDYEKTMERRWENLKAQILREIWESRIMVAFTLAEATKNANEALREWKKEKEIDGYKAKPSLAARKAYKKYLQDKAIEDDKLGNIVLSE